MDGRRNTCPCWMGPGMPFLKGYSDHGQARAETRSPVVGCDFDVKLLAGRAVGSFNVQQLIPIAGAGQRKGNYQHHRAQ